MVPLFNLVVSQKNEKPWEGKGKADVHSDSTNGTWAQGQKPQALNTPTPSATSEVYV